MPRAGRPSYGLVTEQHVKIIRLAAAGKTNASIGRDLGISAHTVKSHLRTIYRRLGVVDRGSLVMVAIRREIISVEDYPLPPLCYNEGARVAVRPDGGNS